MGTLREKCPTYEEFYEAVKGFLTEYLERFNLTEQEIKEYMEKNRSMIQQDYDYNVKQFDGNAGPHTPQIDRTVFLVGCASATASTLELLY